MKKKELSEKLTKLCPVCKTNKKEGLYLTSCNHAVHLKCFDNLQKIKRTKICATCKRPVLKATLRKVLDDQHGNIEIISKNTIIDQLKHQINQATQENLKLKATLNNLTRSLSFDIRDTL